MSPGAKRWLLGGARLVIAGALLVWLVRSGSIDWGSLGGLLAAWPLTVAAFVVLVIDLLVTSARLCVLMTPRGFNVTLRDSMRLSLVGNLFNLFLPGGGGDLVRIFYAASGVAGRRTEIATIMLIDRILGLLGMLLMPLLCIPFFLPLIASSRVLQALLALAAGASLAIALAFAVALSRRGSGSPPVRFLLRLFPLGGYPQRILDTVHAYRGDAVALSQAVVISIVAHVLSSAVVMMLVQATHPGSVRAAIGFLAALGFVANSVPLTPGGLGVGEAAFDSLFAIAGIDGGAEAMLGWRLLLICLAPVGLALYLRGERRYVRTAEAR